MKLENLIDALDSMMNINNNTVMCIADNAGDEFWRGCLADFDKKSWLNRDIVAWWYTDDSNFVVVNVDW